MPTIPPLVITDEERAELQRRVRAHTTPQRAAKRARVVLLAADGVANRQIAPLIGMHQHTVSQWRHRFEAERLAGLEDRPRPGRPLIYGHDTRPTTRPAPGRPARQEHEYVRHGTATLLAAVDVHRGGVLQAAGLDRNTAANFISFLDELDARVPTDLAVHLVLDNGSSPIANATRWWFHEHRRFHPHDTPTHASWLNQAELGWLRRACRQDHLTTSLPCIACGWTSQWNK
jgi:transposase-like protein